jgi:hypothetical protein
MKQNTHTSDTSFNTMSATFVHGFLKTSSKVKLNIFNIIKHNNNIFWYSHSRIIFLKIKYIFKQ